MLRQPEYNSLVQPLNLATGAGLGLKVIAASLLGMLLTSVSLAQINGAPVSVTSPGFGGRQVNGVAPSVTSLGPRGYTPHVPTCCFVGGVPRNPNSNTNFHHHHHNNGFIGGYAVPYYGYYDSGSYVADNQPDDQYDDGRYDGRDNDGRNNDQYNGGPTIFDRRGPGTAAPPAPAPNARRENTQPEPPSDTMAPQAEATPAPEPTQTLLVFKDGHQLEVANYAIVGDTLFDLTAGRRHKIALADLDLPATAKQNEDRGIDFQVPAVPEAN